MNKTILNVPRGIRYLSDWEGFSLPVEPSIIDKQITGCGFTEWCIRNRLNIIVCSPRKILLENKEEQHPGEVFYARNDSEIPKSVDEDLNKAKNNSASRELRENRGLCLDNISKLKNEVDNYYWNTVGSGRPCKILVTYDSFRHVKEVLGDRIKDFYVVIDEFQSIFTDSRFKSSTELEFINYLQDLDKVSFVSATPMIDKYLDELDNFKYLPFITLDWGALEPGRVIRPEVDAKPCDNILTIAKDYIQSYLSGNFQKFNYLDENGNIQEIESRELVVYVNSVKNICDIITKLGLVYNNTNVLCSNTPENQKKIRKAFGLSRGQEGGIGKVPKKGDPHKMFTLCTRTVYLGADFYSTNARSLILSDANIDCLAVDITLDLPQILGRQRLECNPWKNRAELYFKTKTITKTEEEFEKIIQRVREKKKKTENLLLAYSQVLDSSAKHDLAENYQKVAKTYNYKDDYVAVNTHGGSDLFPILNDLVMVAEIRAYEIQQLEYADRFTVINAIYRENIDINNMKLYEFLYKFFNETSQFTERMKLLCDYSFCGEDLRAALKSIPIIYSNYYTILGPEIIKSLSYQRSKLEKEYSSLMNNQDNKESLLDLLILNFKIGEKYPLVFIKNTLREIYEKLGLTLSPKASDLVNYFDIKKVLISNKETGKKDHGYEIIKIKE